MDWHQFYSNEHPAGTVVDPRRRLRFALVGLAILLAIIFIRVIILEVTEGAAFREVAAKALVVQDKPPGARGRILAADGSILAYDKPTHALAVHYRWLQQPVNRDWLHAQARSRLTRQERKDSRRVAEEETRLETQRQQLGHHLAKLSGLSPEAWEARAAQIQTTVERIAQNVNRRRQAALDRTQTDRTPQTDQDTSLAARIGRFVNDTLQGPAEEPERITVAEELDYHVMADHVPLAVVVEIQARPREYPGVKIVERSRRTYPAGCLAANVLGHLGPVSPAEVDAAEPNAYDPDDRAGRMGVERQYETILRGRRGLVEQDRDRSGQVRATRLCRPPQRGRDLVLTIDPRLQRAAEDLLDQALARRALTQSEPAGGAAVVMDVHHGAILAAASTPRFDPNVFEERRAKDLEALMKDPGHPMFDRVARMALPPGSIFKIVSAAALLETATIRPEDKFFCQGYLKEPDRLRCAIYVHSGAGHGEVTLREALAQSCNVYFFHHAGRMGPEPLVDWATRFGLSERSGLDLPDEAAGSIPSPDTFRQAHGRPWRADDTRMMAIGQGAMTVTPIQIVRLVAAIANGGKLVTPHVVSRLGMPDLDDSAAPAQSVETAEDPIPSPPPQPIPGLQASTLAAIREGLEAVVADPQGTGYGTVRLARVAIAGKTGTAQSGASQADHAWFAGYVPAEQPKYAFVVALEHAGSGEEAAGPVAKRLVMQLVQLGRLP